MDFPVKATSQGYASGDWPPHSVWDYNLGLPERPFNGLFHEFHDAPFDSAVPASIPRQSECKQQPCLFTRSPSVNRVYTPPPLVQVEHQYWPAPSTDDVAAAVTGSSNPFAADMDLFGASNNMPSHSLDADAVSRVEAKLQDQSSPFDVPADRFKLPKSAWKPLPIVEAPCGTGGIALTEYIHRRILSMAPNIDSSNAPMSRASAPAPPAVSNSSLYQTSPPSE